MVDRPLRVVVFVVGEDTYAFIFEDLRDRIPLVPVIIGEMESWGVELSVIQVAKGLVLGIDPDVSIGFEYRVIFDGYDGDVDL